MTMYQVKSTDISMIIIIEMYWKRQNYILRTVLVFFIIIDFQRSIGRFMFCEKNETLIICHTIFSKREIGSQYIYIYIYI